MNGTAEALLTVSPRPDWDVELLGGGARGRVGEVPGPLFGGHLYLEIRALRTPDLKQTRSAIAEEHYDEQEADTKPNPLESPVPMDRWPVLLVTSRSEAQR